MDKNLQVKSITTGDQMGIVFSTKLLDSLCSEMLMGRIKPQENKPSLTVVKGETDE